MTYTSDVVDTRMVLNGHGQQLESLEKLDTVGRRDTHVQEDTKEDSNGDLLQNWSHEDAQADEQCNDEVGHALF